MSGPTYHPRGSASEVIFGIHSIREAIRAGRRKIHHLYIQKKRAVKRLREILEFAETNRIPVQWMEKDAFTAAVGHERNQGIGARVSAYPLVEFSTLLLRPQTTRFSPFLLFLDGITDPQNFGALIRTADCVGVDGICIPKDRSAGPTPTVSRASAGALEHIAMARVTNMVRTLSLLKNKGYWILGLDAAEKNSVYSTDLTVPIAVLVGGEHKGIRPLVKKQCDLLISIPQTGRIDSLNASVAGAVFMYEAYRQRRAA